MTRRSPRLTALAASLLALAVATGVATPRLRTGGRERAARGAALAGSTRPDQPCAWVEPDDHCQLEPQAAPGDLVVDAGAVAPRADDSCFVLPPAPAVAFTPTSIRLDALPLHLPSDHLARRASAARGPPALRS